MEAVKHSLIVDLMHEELARREIQITQEEYAIQREGNYLFAALTTNWLNTGETAAAIASGHSNDKTEAMKMYAGVHVFICDNMALSGDEIVMNRKHTTRLNVAAEAHQGLRPYRDGTLVLQRNIEDLKAGPLSLGDAQRKLFEMFYRRLLPTRMLIPATDSYLPKKTAPTGGSSTPAPCTQEPSPNGNIRAHAQLGRYFAWKGEPLCLLTRRCQSRSLGASSIRYAIAGIFQSTPII